ncbi:MAG: transaldolase [Prolixibacteraceae bacterium]|nr:transaldolase [Prolixibacteraceae bacterium]MBT6766667.1 transaldolase [Prolixibacteraceae bacterium]MBT6998767.1 transaldolase [Prolixibacteraceae bacterium]MBT7393957.1 transaldolase [Prolixibacteraceae bacterium]
MTQTTPTVLWNDSSAIEELTNSIGHGAIGATCNPAIVCTVLKQEWDIWKIRIPQLILENPTATEDEIAWMLIEEMSKKAAALLMPIFNREKGKNGRLSIQTDPRLYRDAERILRQAVHFSELAPNIIVKIPVTKAGVIAIEEATYLGVSINATVSYTVPQAITVAEAVERGLVRREKEGKDINTMGPVCTIMVGRLDDLLKEVAEKENIIANPEIMDWAGVAVMKKAYQIYRERGYRLRLLSAAFRNHLHWSEFIGGDVVISPPWKWQQRYNASDVTVENRMDTPVDKKVIAELEKKFVDFRRAYDENGMTVEEFDGFGATVRTLNQFCQATSDVIAKIREMMLL